MISHEVYRRLGFLGSSYSSIIPNKVQDDNLFWSTRVALSTFGNRLLSLEMKYSQGSGVILLDSFFQDKSFAIKKHRHKIPKKGMLTSVNRDARTIDYSEQVASLDEGIVGFIPFDEGIGLSYAYSQRHLYCIRGRSHERRNLTPHPVGERPIFSFAGRLMLHSGGRIFECGNREGLFDAASSLVAPKWNQVIDRDIDAYDVYAREKHAFLAAWSAGDSTLSIYGKDFRLADARVIRLPPGTTVTDLHMLARDQDDNLTALLVLSDGTMLKVDDTCPYDSENRWMRLGGGDARHFKAENIDAYLKSDSLDLRFADFGRFIPLGSESFGFIKDGFLYLVNNRTQVLIRPHGGNVGAKDT